MAGNITLPKVQSQARVINPVQGPAPKADSTAAIIGAVADTAVDVMRFNAEEERRQAVLQRQANLDAQKAEDDMTVATAISDVNTMLAQREEAQVAQTTLQSMSADLERALADKDKSEEDVKLERAFIAQFQKVKTAQEQGLFDDNRFSIMAREAKQQMISRHPRLASEIDKIYSVTTGKQPSASTGAVAKQQLQFNRNMEAKYGLGYTAEDVMAETSKQRATALAAENLELGKATGTLDFGKVSSTHNVTLNSAIDSISLKAGNIYSQKQALSQDDLDGINSQIEASKRVYVRSFDNDIAALRQQGRVIDPAQVRAQKDNALKQLDDLQTFVNDKSLQKMLGKRNQVEKEMWQAGLGGQISKLNSIAGTLGSGGLTALSGMISTSNPAQDQAVRALVADSDIPLDATAIDNTKQLIMDAASRVANPTLVPGFEKLDTFYGLGAIKAGTTTPTVQTNTLRNLNKLVKEPQDVSGAIQQLNDPKVSLNYSKADDSVKNELVQTANGFESMMFDEIESGGYNISYDKDTQSLIVFRVKEPAGIATGRGIFGKNVQREEVQEDINVTKEIPTGRGIAGKRFNQGLSNLPKTVNRGLTKSMNELFKFHRNPNYAGIVQPADKWLADITNKFQPQQPEATIAE